METRCTDKAVFVSGKAKTDIRRKGGPCDRGEEGCVTSYVEKEMMSVRRDKREAKPCAA